MRVTRALDKLQGLLKRRGVTTSAATLSLVLSAHAVQAAPVGLAVTISTGAVLAGTTLTTTAAATATKAIVMTTTQKALVAVTLAAAVGTGIYEARQASAFRNQVNTLQQQRTALTEQLTRERDDTLTKVAALNGGNNPSPSPADRSEILRLRGEVTRLQNERADWERFRNDEARRAQTNPGPQPAFQHRFLSRSTWANAGLNSPAQALETFLWAWTSKNEAAILQASALGTNGQPFRLTGMASDFQDRLMGAQVLSFTSATTNPDVVTATMIYEGSNHAVDRSGRSFESIGHGILAFRFEKVDGEWRFAGKTW